MLLLLCQLQEATSWSIISNTRSRSFALHMIDPWREEPEKPLIVMDGKPMFASTTVNATTTTTATTPQFGESVSLRDRPTTSNVDDDDDDDNPVMTVAAMQRRNVAVAVASIFLAAANYFWQFTHPVTPVQLLATMQSHSSPVTVIGQNAKPTVVDFWAPWYVLLPIVVVFERVSPKSILTTRHVQVRKLQTISPHSGRH